MGKSNWTIVALTVAFVIIQACGDAMGTGNIVTPGAVPVGNPNPDQPNVTPPMMMTYLTEDGGWPDFDYDDGRTFWDGGTPIELGEWHWNQGVSSYRGQNGQRLTASCVMNGSEFAVWGANPYTDDSPICTAAAHLGYLNRASGGQVTVEIRPAQRSFAGMNQNGVASFSWGPYPGSYVVIRP